MKFVKKNIVCILLVFICAACSNDGDETPTDKNIMLTFGWFADSKCSGGCGQIYKIEAGKIFKDIDYNYPEGDVFEGNFQEVKDVDYQDYKALLNLPKEIFNQPNGYLECTGCLEVDSGGFYIEYQSESMHKSWRIRNAQYPPYMESYRALILNKLEKLNSL
ncbi:hypothetical protein VOI54_07485 [Tamlana sp. 2201CG12-4]|uniref:hypothetical protein n=1 Tax=Tamlana sp. 2201CG12-4 TaxID=3112582 RepID=UPI002DBF5CA7|nr:hypothetical protein [Tamlana sp. 2201CG12-4]MEC3906856.1 hypothetical protein [Tamlana sp. 2201CG12-4]